MKLIEIKKDQEFIYSGFIWIFEGNKLKRLRKYDGKKSKESKPIPSEAEIKKYALDNGYDPNFMWEKAKGYIDAGMRDSQDNPVKNLKLKLNQIWFKPEHKLKQAITQDFFQENV